MIGCFDTKAEDFAYLYSCLKTLDVQVMSINIGVLGTTDLFPIDIEAEQLVKHVDVGFEELKSSKDRTEVVNNMGRAAAQELANLVQEKKIHGVISMGGGGGTFMALTAMQAVPFGLPKICVSTLATKDLSTQVGPKDIVLMPSIVDVAGVNKISRVVISHAAGAIVGMANATTSKNQTSKGTIAISMFGNTTECVDNCTALLRQKDYEVLAFHAVGSGGKTMESLIRDGYIDAVLDITTTELADDLCGGICSAGPDRLTAASDMGIPQVVVPGCLDMVNFAYMDSVPEKYKDRLLYSWAPDVTLMRTNEEENSVLGKSIAKKLNASQGKVAVLIPTKGISKISAKGGVFYKPEIDEVLFEVLEENLNDDISIDKLDFNVNDPEFSKRAVEILLEFMK